MSHTSNPTGLRRIWKPVAVISAGGAAAAAWLEEIILFAEDILAILFLPIIASVLYLFNHYVFKSRHPRRKDNSQSGDKK